MRSDGIYVSRVTGVNFNEPEVNIGACIMVYLDEKWWDLCVPSDRGEL